MNRNTFLRTAVAALMLTAGMASAADWPTKPITLVVPFVAGGTTDIVARTVGQKLSEALKQPVIIDNRGGAGGTVGATIASKAPADGYTLFLATIAHSIAPGLYKKLAYDFQRDFDPVALVASTPNVLIVNEKVPAKTVAELVAYIKANPGIGLDELEVAFRGAGFRFYLYALTAEVPYSQCLIGPHGQRDVEYVWTLNPRARPRHFNAIGHRMAATPEENLQRLKRAGTVEDELLPICHVCRGIYSFGSSLFLPFSLADHWEI